MEVRKEGICFNTVFNKTIPEAFFPPLIIAITAASLFSCTNIVHFTYHNHDNTAVLMLMFHFYTV